MPTVRLDDDVFQWLKSLAEPFTDTPNSVVRRLREQCHVAPKVPPEATKDATVPIELPASLNPPRRRSVRATASLTPQPIYETFLLHVLHTQFKGQASKQDATRATIALMQSRGFITPADLEYVSTGETKAQNTIAWGRNALKDSGFISRNSPHGVWELTANGKEEAARRPVPEAKSAERFS